MVPLSTDTIPTGIRYTTSSNGQSTATAFTISRIGSRAEPGLHEVPVPEQHGVGHRAEEARAHEEPGQAQRVVTAHERGRTEQADHADDRREEVEPRVELGQRLVVVVGRVSPRHRGDAFAASLAALCAAHAPRRRVARTLCSSAIAAHTAMSAVHTLRIVAPVPSSPAPETTDRTAITPKEMRSSQP